jgi:hypothetical protein
MTPVPRDNYRVGLPDTGKYKLLFNSDATTKYELRFPSQKKIIYCPKKIGKRIHELDLPLLWDGL